jgi:hypothetical protein
MRTISSLTAHMNNAEQVALPAMHKEATHTVLQPIYQRALAQNYIIPHQQNRPASLARIHDEMRTAIAKAREMEDVDFDKAQTIMTAPICTLYARRVHFVSEKLLLVHYGLIFAHSFARNNTNAVHRNVRDGLTVGAPFCE